MELLQVTQKELKATTKVTSHFREGFKVRGLMGSLSASGSHPTSTDFSASWVSDEWGEPALPWLCFSTSSAGAEAGDVLLSPGRSCGPWEEGVSDMEQ